jgi:signal transduction histidine kinase
VSSADHWRRARRIALLLSAILIPTAAVILLGVRVLRQENELAARRAQEQRRDALDQLRRELSARLQALRLGEVNRIIGDSGRRLPPDSPIVFVAPMVQDRGQDRIVLPWETTDVVPRPTAEFARAQVDGEWREFRQNDAAAAVASYRHAYDVARSRWEQCSARLWLGRAYRKAGMTADAEQTDRAAVHACGDVADADNVPVALYAAERLLTNAPGDSAAIEYVMRRASAPQSRCVDASAFATAPADRRRPGGGGCSPRWRAPNEAFLLQSLLRRIADPAATEPLRTLVAEIRNAEQISALVEDPHDQLGKLQRASRSAPGDLAWVGYGDEPWLLTLVSPSSFAEPVVMAVSSRRILPADVALHVTPTAAAVPLGDGFVDLHVEWPRGRFADPAAIPGLLYGWMLAIVLAAALLAGYLLLRDVHRETETAAMRSHFVASVSHELKTPLTSIRAHAETLLMGRAASAETTSDYLRTIVSESERLTRLVDSVLDFSRIEQGRKSYHLRETPLAEVVRSAAKAMEYPLSQLGFTLTISTDGTAPTVRADPEALTQAILNLLGNAMKYSGDARHIQIRIGTRHDEAFVDVVDHGIGIARDDQARIFERFQRVQSVETSGIAGTGLGLTLALHVVEAHRGHIAVVSDPGRGSTFSVRIPLLAEA